MRVLVVAPHPDDEAIGMGGTIKKLLLSNHEVEVLHLTAGERGCPGVSIEETIRIRIEEAKASAAYLGSTILENWYLPDGMIQYSDILRDKLTEVIHRYDLVYVTHEKESHPDHRMAGKLVREALKQLDKPPDCLTYEVWTPLQVVDRVVDISNVLIDKKNAIQAHVSQVQRQSFDAAAIGLSKYRGVMNGHCEYAEVFSRMRLTGAEGMKVAVALLTYAPSVDHPRSEYARRTLISLLRNLEVGPSNTLHIHIADDGSDQEHVNYLFNVAKNAGYEPTVSNAERGGYGRSYNLACQALHDSFDVILPLEDDWEMLRPFNLDELLRSIDESDGVIRSVRLGYMGFTGEMKGKLVHSAGLTHLLLDPDSSEPHVFAGGPRLDTVAYQRDVGEWPEGIAAGYVEWEVTHRWNARNGVCWPMDICIPASQRQGAIFGHIGEVGVGSLVPQKEVI